MSERLNRSLITVARSIL
jgi:hypothetical protein